MGSSQGVGEGMILKVSRRVSSYDAQSQQLYRDVTFPIGFLKVIHVESNAAVARLDHMLPADKMPSLNPPAIMVGDLVKPQ